MAPHEAPAIGAPERPWLTHGGLRALAERTVAALNGMGIGRGDRVALVVPNGPEAASSFVTIACGATTAPLNPGYKADEFAFYLKRRRCPGAGHPGGLGKPGARRGNDAWHSGGRTVLPEGPAGSFTLARAAGHEQARLPPGTAEAEDVALILHTSGTTSRPKIVPLRHVNVTASAYNIGAVLALGPDDVCMNIMPLFHIHGLIAATLASLAAGGAVSCTAGFNGFRFYSWFEQVRPTWYTAVPTMHQAILELAPRHTAAIAAGRLRFIRSSSSSLPAQVMTAMEAAFGVPVIESYGMTEAAHQMASNPLPPRPRFPGCVGIAAGPEVAIMDEAGALLPPGALRRGGDPRPQRDRGIREQSSRQRRRVHQRLVPHRRPGGAGRRRLSAADRAAEGTDQPRRREVQPAGGG